MTTLTARAAMVINKLSELGPCYASDLAAAMNEQRQYVATTLDYAYNRHKLVSVDSVDDSEFGRARRMYRRTDKPFEVFVRKTSEQIASQKRERERVRDAAIAAGDRVERRSHERETTVDGARLIELVDRRHNAHDGIRLRGWCAGQSTLARVW